MKTPLAESGASGPIVDPSTVEAFRAYREQAGFSKQGLSREIGASAAYVPQLERGTFNPSGPKRAQLAEALGVPVETLFSGWPPPPHEEAAARRAEVVRLHREGVSQREIAKRLEIAYSTVERDLDEAGEPRHNGTRTLVLDGRVPVSNVARQYHMKPAMLREAIDAGIVHGERIESPGFAWGHVYLVNQDELAEDLAALPRCSHEGCDRPAIRPTGTCGVHAAARMMKGTRKSAETCRRMSAGKLGNLRPDVRVRVAAMHADREAKYRWGVCLAEGRARHMAREKATKMIRRWKGRLGGLEKGGGDGPGVKYTPEQERIVRTMKEALPTVGRARIAEWVSKRTGTPITEKQVRAILSRPPG